MCPSHEAADYVLAYPAYPVRMPMLITLRNQKFIDTRHLLQQIEINRFGGKVVENADTEILKVWNSLLGTFYTLKKVA